MKDKKWQIAGKNSKTHLIDHILKNRGIKTKKERDQFLNPPHPSLFTSKDVGIDQKELQKALDRIQKAIVNKESIVVYTDYDADGVTGGAVLWEALYTLGAQVMPYVPHRVNEGYGFSVKGIDNVIAQHNPKLIISVDHGITAEEKIAHAKKKGIDVIVTDHHTIPEKPPISAYAIVHTTQLSGSGVAWFLSKELLKEKNDELLALGTIGTIADLVPLTGVNRSIAQHGLMALSHTSRVGLRELFKEAGLTGNLEPYHVSHIVAPRINATGRLTHALDALRLLCTKDITRATTLAHTLGSVNRERQQLLEEMNTHARDVFNNEIPLLLFVAHENYNQGVIGLVAGRLVEELYRPAIVLWKGLEFSKASVRSIPGLDIIEILRKASDLLVDVGGHPMAAGFTVETKNLEKLQQKLLELVSEKLTDELLIPRLTIDAELNLDDISLDLFHQIKTLAPFGVGNPTPVFALRNVVPADARLIGKDNSHLKFRISCLDVIGFRMAHFHKDVVSGKPIDIAFTLDQNTWNGSVSVQLKVKDIQVS